MTEQLNNPVAIIAILAGLAVLVREISWFSKTIKGDANPYSNAQRSFERLSETLQAVSTSLVMMNKQLEHQLKITENGFDRLEAKVDRIRR